MSLDSETNSAAKDCVTQVRFPLLGADHLTSDGGGRGLSDFEKNILQVHKHKKKVLAQDHRATKKSCTHSELEKSSGKMFSKLTY